MSMKSNKEVISAGRSLAQNAVSIVVDDTSDLLAFTDAPTGNGRVQLEDMSKFRLKVKDIGGKQRDVFTIGIF